METITIIAIVASLVVIVLGSMTWKEDLIRYVNRMRALEYKKCAFALERLFPVWVALGTLMNVAMIAYFPGTQLVVCILATVFMFARQYVKEKYGIEC